MNLFTKTIETKAPAKQGYVDLTEDLQAAITESDFAGESWRRLCRDFADALGHPDGTDLAKA